MPSVEGSSARSTLDSDSPASTRIVASPRNGGLELELLSENESIVYGSMTFGRARQVMMMALHYLLSVVTHSVSEIEDGDFAVFVVRLSAAERGVSGHETTHHHQKNRSSQHSKRAHHKGPVAARCLARLGTVDAAVAEQLTGAVSVHFPDDGWIAIEDVSKHPATCDVTRPDGKSKLRTFVCARVERLCVCLVSDHRLAAAFDVLGPQFREAVAVFRSQLDELDATLKAERLSRGVEREHELRKLEAQTNRFLRHEVKNGIIGALADLDALKCAVLRLSEHPPDGLSSGGVSSSSSDSDDQVDPPFPRTTTADDDGPESNGNDGPVNRHFSLSGQQSGTRHHNGASPVPAAAPSSTTHHNGAPPAPPAAAWNTKKKKKKQAQKEDATEPVADILEALDAVAQDMSQTMQVVLSVSMVSEVLAGKYQPRIAPIDLGQLCASIIVPGGLKVEPGSFRVETDAALVRHILTNAVSNAAKYGDANSVISVHFTTTESRHPNDDLENPRTGASLFPRAGGSTAFDAQTEARSAGDSRRPSYFDDDDDDENGDPIVTCQVVNAAGPGHERLLRLKDPNSIFTQGTRYHDETTRDAPSTNVATGRLLSAGDGAWIMQRCADALGGKCAIDFGPTSTRFSVRFPARRSRTPPISPTGSWGANSTGALGVDTMSSYGCPLLASPPAVAPRSRATHHQHQGTSGTAAERVIPVLDDDDEQPGAGGENASNQSRRKKNQHLDDAGERGDGCVPSKSQLHLVASNPPDETCLDDRAGPSTETAPVSVPQQGTDGAAHSQQPDRSRRTSESAAASRLRASIGSDTGKTAHSPFEDLFQLPPGTILVALDDAASQRRLLARYFQYLRPADTAIFGEDPDTVDTFVARAADLVLRAPRARVVFFLDDHLLFRLQDGSTVTASGITLGQQLRTVLCQKDAEHRTLFLVRTAEDSQAKVDHCRRVLHDHFPKAPMKAATFKRMLAAAWAARWVDHERRRNTLPS